MNLKLALVLLLPLLAGFALGQDRPQIEKKDGFASMTFHVEFNRDNYQLGEPIYVTFRLSNLTPDAQTIYNSTFVQDASLKVMSNGVVSRFERFTSNSGAGQRLVGTVPPKWNTTSDEVIHSPFVGAFFGKPGSYKIQFVLRSWDGSSVIESNVIDVAIQEPNGANAEAFEFLQSSEAFFGQSSWIPVDERERDLLETFVQKYGQTIYGEVAIINLAQFYVARGELDKAFVELEKIKNSKHRAIAVDTARTISEINKRRTSSPLKKL